MKFVNRNGRSVTWVRRWLVALAIVTSLQSSSLCAADRPRAGEAKLNSDIPAAIQAEAQLRGLQLSSLKQQGDYWIACEKDGASCVVLGKATQALNSQRSTAARLTGLPASAMLEVHQYGQAVQHVPLANATRYGHLTRSSTGSLSFELNTGVEARVGVLGNTQQVIDTLPRYRREGPNLVRTKDFKLVQDYMDARPNESFTVVVTVPSLCEPCRQLDKLVHEKVTASAGALPTKVFILEYFAFAEAERELLGAGAVFPTTLVYRAEAQPRQSISRVIGNLRGSQLADITGPLVARFRRGAPHTMSRGVIAQELLFR